MNLANILTFSRIVLIIPFVIFLLQENFLAALSLFIVASITDFLDGYIARKFNMITGLGKFLDPLADKLLVISALICLIGWVPAWAVIVIVSREFIVTGFRLAVVEKDNKAVIAADIWGKIKTAFTMVAICAILYIIDLLYNPWMSIAVSLSRYDLTLIIDMLIYVCVTLTVFSGLTMIVKNRKLFSDKEREQNGQ